MDENLPNGPIVTVLQAMEYDARAPSRGTQDRSLIQWIASFGGVWITADERARMSYRDEIQKAGIHIVLVQRPRQGLSRRAAIRLIVYLIEKVIQDVARARSPQVYRLRYSGDRPIAEFLSSGERWRTLS